MTHKYIIATKTSVVGFCVAAKEEDTKEGVIYQGDLKGFMEE